MNKLRNFQIQAIKLAAVEIRISQTLRQRAPMYYYLRRKGKALRKELKKVRWIKNKLHRHELELQLLLHLESVEDAQGAIENIGDLFSAHSLWQEYRGRLLSDGIDNHASRIHAGAAQAIGRNAAASMAFNDLICSLFTMQYPPKPEHLNND